MGVINVTPDSFYDGGRYKERESAVVHANRLIEEGADILDIGGESSRPGAHKISEREEIGRVVPVIEAIRRSTDLPISVDTTKAAVAEEALRAGATWINDISGGRFDSNMARIASQTACPVVLMHSRKTPADMQNNPSYDNVVPEINTELMESVDRFVSQGVFRENIILDPGIGFAKRYEDNIAVIRGLGTLIEGGFPILVGTSRKSFIGAITERDPEERLAGTLASVAACFIRGVKFFRVHDVKETRDFLKVFDSIQNGR